jgi:hypothetical protein
VTPASDDLVVNAEPTADVDESETAELGVEDDLAEPSDVDAGEPKPKRRTRRGSRGGRGRKRKPAAANGHVDEVGQIVTDLSEAEALTSLVIDGLAEPQTDQQEPPLRRAPRIHVPDDRSTERQPDGQPDADGNATVEHDGAAEAVNEVPAEGDEAPQDGVPQRKRTRRGSRGGRNRRRKTSAAAEDGAANDEVSIAGDDGSGREEKAEGAERQEKAVSRKPASVGDPSGYVPMSEWLDDFDR